MRDKDAALLAFIEEEYRKTGFAPTYREIAASGLMRSMVTINAAMRRLSEAEEVIFLNCRKHYIPARWQQLAGQRQQERHEAHVQSLKREIAVLSDKIRRMNEIAALGETGKPLRIVVTTAEYERLKDGIPKWDDPNAVIQKDWTWVDKA